MKKPVGLAVTFVAALALAFLSLPTLDAPSAYADTGEYEYEVLPGIRRALPANLRVTTGWHNRERNAIDLVHYEPPGSYSYGVTLNAPVRAYFRHIAGEKILKARIKKHFSGYGCKGLRVEILDGSDPIASISYVHVEASAEAVAELEKTSAQELRTWDLRQNNQETVLDIVLGTLVRHRTGDDPAGDISGVENNIRCSTGPHIHMAGYNESTAPVVVLNKSSEASRGLPDVLSSATETDRACIAPDEWLMKIVSPDRTPAGTATAAPTNTCPPTDLRLSKPSDDDRLDLAYEVSQPPTVYEEPYRIQTPGYPDGMKFELYRAASEAELCEPEESTCSAQYTEMVHFCGADETPAADNCAPSPTTTPAQSVAFDGLDGGYFYQARGTGCVHKSATDDTLVCGAWSGLSGAVELPAVLDPPANLTATGRNGQIALTWDDPSDTTITKYDVRRRLTSATAQGAWNAISGSGATTTSHTLTGLTNDMEYTVQLRAVNASGDGPPSTATGTPTAPPPRPQPPTGRGCLDPNVFNALTSWRQGCASTTAAALTQALREYGVCGLWLWRDSMWVKYFRFSDGTLLPGAENFRIVAGNTLFVPICNTTRDGAIILPDPPPIPFPS